MASQRKSWSAFGRVGGPPLHTVVEECHPLLLDRGTPPGEPPVIDKGADAQQGWHRGRRQLLDETRALGRESEAPQTLRHGHVQEGLLGPGRASAGGGPPHRSRWGGV